MKGTGLKEYRDTDGNLGALILRRGAGATVELLFVSLWESLDAVRGFAGYDYARAVFYPEDDAFLVERDLHVEHYELAAAELPLEEAPQAACRTRCTTPCSPRRLPRPP